MKFFSAVFILLFLESVKTSSNIRGDIDPELEEWWWHDKVYGGPKHEDCPVFDKSVSEESDKEYAMKMIEATKECGYYEKKGCYDKLAGSGLETIPRSIVFPGDGPGELEYKPYIVQFDIGIHENLYDTVHNTWEDYGGEKRDCIGCNETDKTQGEKCLELIVMGGGASTGGCAGKCGTGCTYLSSAGFAKDCMKHDVCIAYKALVQMYDETYTKYPWMRDDGFCYDMDCGDEAAQTVMNCIIDNWWVNEAITCEEDKFRKYKDAQGWWSIITNVHGGPCQNFISWSNGQGLPNRDRIENPYMIEQMQATEG